MANVELNESQINVIRKMKNGCVLYADVGTGKSRTALGYFYTKVCGGKLPVIHGVYAPPATPKDIYIITTAKKRDDEEWLDECVAFDIFSDSKESICGIHVIVDSWNNIRKYENIRNAFFIFDEQRAGGKGKWAKLFVKIAKRNQWIMLSATPGDKWEEYIPLFLANGFYTNKTEFYQRHVIFSRYTTYPKIIGYVNEHELVARRNDILVKMQSQKRTHVQHEDVSCQYDKELYKKIFRDRWNPFDNEPIEETGKLCYLLRRAVNSNVSRIDKLLEIQERHSKLVIFYNYDFELELMKEAFTAHDIPYAEWNGKKHQTVPVGDVWCYLVQFNSGSEGWNCITTNAMVFFSQTYSYKMSIQAAGRIDRFNTPFTNLYYYHLKSVAPIDIAIARAIRDKRDFNEKGDFLSRIAT